MVFGYVVISIVYGISIDPYSDRKRAVKLPELYSTDVLYLKRHSSGRATHVWCFWARGQLLHDPAPHRGKGTEKKGERQRSLRQIQNRSSFASRACALS